MNHFNNLNLSHIAKAKNRYKHILMASGQNGVMNANPQNIAQSLLLNVGCIKNLI